MKHFLITRFNLKASRWSVTKSGSTVLDEEWLSDRFNIFEKYCLPSVINQSNQDFRWLVFFDTDTPENYIDRINHASKNCVPFKAIFINNIDKLLNAIKREVVESNPKIGESIITSRLDNDDMIHKDFIQSVQTKKVSGAKIIVDMRKGYRMNDKGKVINIGKKFGPFINLIEPFEGFETILSRDHGDWRREDPSIIKTENQRLWMQFIHDKNMINSFPLLSSRVRDMNFQDFGIEKP